MPMWIFADFRFFRVAPRKPTGDFLPESARDPKDVERLRKRLLPNAAFKKLEHADSRARNWLACLCGWLAFLLLSAPLAPAAEAIVLQGNTLRISVSAAGTEYRELVEIRDGESW